ncbi:MAG: YggT family protein, partial [Prochlorococcus sp.]
MSFVTPILIEALPTLHLVLAFSLGAWTLTFIFRIVLSWYPQVK